MRKIFHNTNDLCSSYLAAEVAFISDCFRCHDGSYIVWTLFCAAEISGRAFEREPRSRREHLQRIWAALRRGCRVRRIRCLEQIR